MRFQTQSRTAPPITWKCRPRPRRCGKLARRAWLGSSPSAPAKAGARPPRIPAYTGISGIGLSLRNELDVHVSLQALDAAFRSITRFLDAAERSLGRRDRDTVDAHHPGLQRVTDRRRILVRGGERIGGESELKRIGALDHFVEGLERHDWCDRTERFLSHDLGIVGHIGNDGRLKEEALVAVPRAAGEDLSAAILGVVDEAFHGVEPARVG